MENNDGNVYAHYLAELNEIAELDRRYYLNKTPSRKERAAYALRKDRLARLRSHLTAEICLSQDQTIRDVPFQIRVKDAASGEFSRRPATSSTSSPHSAATTPHCVAV